MNKIIISVIILFSTLSYAQQTIIVTGGAGYVGSQLSERLLDESYRVIIIDNLTGTYDPIWKENNLKQVRKHDPTGKNLAIYKIDLCDQELVNQVFEIERPDVVCHFAAHAAVRDSVGKPHEYIENNLFSTLSLLEAAQLYPVSHLILASSSCAYGGGGTVPYTENQPCDRPYSPYGFTKRSMEMLAYTYHHMYGMRITCLRTFTGYGPRCRPDTAAFKFMDAIHHERPIPIFGDGTIYRDFTYVEDVIKGTLLAIKKPFDFEIINISGGKSITIKEFAERIAQAIGKKPIFNYLLSKKEDQVITKANITKAKQLLGYEPTIDFDEGLKRMYAWYLTEYLTQATNRLCLNKLFSKNLIDYKILYLLG